MEPNKNRINRTFIAVFVFYGVLSALMVAGVHAMAALRPMY
jgi:hypothetical protein